MKFEELKKLNLYELHRLAEIYESKTKSAEHGCSTKDEDNALFMYELFIAEIADRELMIITELAITNPAK